MDRLLISPSPCCKILCLSLDHSPMQYSAFSLPDFWQVLAEPLLLASFLGVLLALARVAGAQVDSLVSAEWFIGLDFMSDHTDNGLCTMVLVVRWVMDRGQ